MLGIRDVQPVVLVHHEDSANLTGHTRRFTVLEYVVKYTRSAGLSNFVLEELENAVLISPSIVTMKLSGRTIYSFVFPTTNAFA